MNIRHNAYTENLGTDWVALDAGLTPIARSTDEASLRRAVPNAAHYLSGEQVADAAEAMAKTLRAAAKPQLDHDKNGKAGGAKKPVDALDELQDKRTDAEKEAAEAAEKEAAAEKAVEDAIIAAAEERAAAEKEAAEKEAAEKEAAEKEAADKATAEKEAAEKEAAEKEAAEKEAAEKEAAEKEAAEKEAAEKEAAEEAARRPGGPSPARRQRKPAAN